MRLRVFSERSAHVGGFSGGCAAFSMSVIVRTAVEPTALRLSLNESLVVHCYRWQLSGRQGTPVTLTWSFVPDGNLLPRQSKQQLISFFDTIWRRPRGNRLHTSSRFGRFQQSFDCITWPSRA